MPLIPGPSPSAGLTIVDQPPALPKMVKAAATTTSVSFAGPNAPLGWYVDRITVKSAAAIGSALFPASTSQAFVYVGSDAQTAMADANLADLTLIGDLDIADEQAPIYVDAGQVLVVVWTNATVGAIYTARIQYRVVAKGAF